MKLSIPTTIACLFPSRFIDRKYEWEDVDIEEVAEEFEWREDPLNGILDFRTHPQKTLERKRGDCEDWAFLAASWLEAHDFEWGIAVTGKRPFFGHVVAYSEHSVYSNGYIIDESLEEYLNDREDNWMMVIES